MECFYVGDSYPPPCSLVADPSLWRRAEGDLYDILVGLKVFSSRSQAKKNFKGPTPEAGFNFYWGVGKCRLDICLYLPGVPYSANDFDSDESWARLAVRLGMISLDGVTVRDPELPVTGAGQVLSVVGREV
jgi:hypothetical protein